MTVCGPDTRITLHFSVRLMDGSVLDATPEDRPASFVWGDGSLLPGFEKALLGLQAGDRRSVFITANEGFGQHRSENIQQFPESQFKSPVEAGMIISFADHAGAELPGVVTALEDGWVTVDFNHPLADRDLTFDVEIVAVEPWVPTQRVELRDPV